MPLRLLRSIPPVLLWGGLMLAATIGMWLGRAQIEQAHVALIYLLVILGGSAFGGRAIGVTLACVGFIFIDYFFQPPFDSFSIDKRPDWLVLVAFLATALVATQLLARANAEADAARRSAEEIDRLSSLGAETLSVGRAEDALLAIAKVIRNTIGAATCEIYLRRDGDDGPLHRAARAGDAVAVPADAVDVVARRGRVASVAADGTIREFDARIGLAPLADAVPARELLVPLLVHDRTVGVLRLANTQPIDLDAGERRFLAALAYYAALGVERVRLVAEAEHAEALREADRLKDALLASVSHDLRTPLTTIKALAHDIAGTGDERATVVEQQADRLNRVVADLLELSRMNAGELPVRHELNAAEDLVGAAIQQAAGALHGREIRTSIAWSEPVLVGRFDFVHSLRILVNLIENATKYSPSDTPIDIALAREGDELLLRVCDRGPGVSPSERDRIFQPFYRPAGMSPDVGGAGLGLAISRRLAVAQRGSLTYEDRDGGGSTFTLRLPAAMIDDSVRNGELDDPASRAAPAPAEPSAPANAGSARPD